MTVSVLQLQRDVLDTIAAKRAELTQLEAAFNAAYLAYSTLPPGDLRDANEAVCRRVGAALLGFF